MNDQTKPEEKTEEIIDAVDVAKATRKVTEYLEGIYGNLNLLLFRIEDVRPNTDKSKYIVICSLLTNVGGPRTYYYVKVDIKSGNLIKVFKGFRNQETKKIDWKEENLPPGEQ